MSFFTTPRNLFYFGLLLVLATGWFSVGYHHPDEHYQILEFAKYKLGEAPAADLPWEFHEQMRPGLQPFWAYCMILFSRFLGISDPFVQAAIMRMVAGVLAFLVYWRWTTVLGAGMRDGGLLLRISLVFFWMLPYMNVRFSSENTSAIAFFAGLLFIFPKPKDKKTGALVLGGFLLCLSFFFRYQIAFAGIGVGAWLLFVEKPSLAGWAALVGGAILACIPGLAADFWLYDDWVVAPYNYFAQNIIEDKAAGFGVSPWWWYFTELPIVLMPPLSFFIFWFMGTGIRRNPWHLFVWVLVPFVLGHSMIDHKESRFLFPMVFPVFYLAVAGWDYYSREHALSGWLKKLFKFLVVVNMISLLFRCFYPANDLLPYLRFLRQYNVAHPQAVIFTEKTGPKKKETLTPHFYQTPWINIEVLDSLEQLNDRTLYQPKAWDAIYFRSENVGFCPAGFQTTRIYRWYPEWILWCNVNNWQARTRIWSVYELQQ